MIEIIKTDNPDIVIERSVVEREIDIQRLVSLMETYKSYYEKEYTDEEKLNIGLITIEEEKRENEGKYLYYKNELEKYGYNSN